MQNREIDDIDEKNKGNLKKKQKDLSSQNSSLQSFTVFDADALLKFFKSFFPLIFACQCPK